jgi:hypothetical protein
LSDVVYAGPNMVVMGLAMIFNMVECWIQIMLAIFGTVFVNFLSAQLPWSCGPRSM